MKKYFALILALALLCTMAACGQKTEEYTYPVMEAPDLSGTELSTAETAEASFPYDASSWVIDDSTTPYTFYHTESMLTDQAANFNLSVGEVFDHSLNQEMADAFAQTFVETNLFIEVKLAELRLIHGSPAIYMETTTTYTDEAIDTALENGVLTQEFIDAVGGREFFLNAPPLDQLVICPVADNHLCVFGATYFNEEQKQDIIDAVVIACSGLEIP